MSCCRYAIYVATNDNNGSISEIEKHILCPSRHCALPHISPISGLLCLLTHPPFLQHLESLSSPSTVRSLRTVLISAFRSTQFISLFTPLPTQHTPLLSNDLVCSRVISPRMAQVQPSPTNPPPPALNGQPSTTSSNPQQPAPISWEGDRMYVFVSTCNPFFLIRATQGLMYTSTTTSSSVVFEKLRRNSF